MAINQKSKETNKPGVPHANYSCTEYTCIYNITLRGQTQQCSVAKPKGSADLYFTRRGTQMPHLTKASLYERPYLLSQRDYPGQQSNEDIGEQTSLMCLIDDHYRVPAEHKVLVVAGGGARKGGVRKGGGGRKSKVRKGGDVKGYKHNTPSYLFHLLQKDSISHEKDSSVL